MNKTLFFFVMLLAGVFTFQSCATTDPYTGEQKTSKATWGAVIGAAGGAAVGALTGDDSKERRKRALIGAGIGGVSGGAVGAYMDRQEAALREQLRGSGVSVTRSEDRIILNMPGHITFAVDSAGIDADFYDVLNAVSLVLEEYDQTLVAITGHTDNTGPVDYNQRLSERRAESVARYLQSQGIDPMRLMPQGMGIHAPIATNETAQGRQQNRRVEIELEPIVSEG